ncbi:MAG TPA: serine/threonine-protein kinase, partial [Kofleriaceae bacterium]|nr:serine/threonine-protein kinase [Kofleriaceae bacterium]
MNLIGRQIGSYVVERELGSGGTGTVYLCNHTLIERKVAVKVLHDDLACQPDQVARFFQEAKAAADIGHPNIVVIIDFGEITVPEGVRSYLMMECLDGASLDKKLRTESFSLDQIAHILEQICSALMASHGKGIIHRDLKPANVQICPRSFDPLFVKLLDFGIAKLTAPTPDSRRTQYGVVLGTPTYMSPEQCEGKGAIDHRSDIYSLGVMLYELLTGTVPFLGEVRDVLLGHLMKAPLPPRHHNPAVPPEWEALCLHMMEKSRDTRFQSIGEVAQALADLPRHAQDYAAFASIRQETGHSGHTMRLDSSEDGRAAAERPTLHVSLSSLTGAQPLPTHITGQTTPVAQPAPPSPTPPPMMAPVAV